MPIRHLRRIPSTILAKVGALPSDLVAVGAFVGVTDADLRKGRYAGVGLRYSEDGPVFSEVVLPSAELGPFCRRNADNYYVTRIAPARPKLFVALRTKRSRKAMRLLPVALERVVQSTKPRRERILVFAKQLHLEVTQVGADMDKGRYAFGFRLAEPLSRDTPAFAASLLESLNLLAECVGVIDVFEWESSPADLFETIRVPWELLPPGQRDTDLKRIVSRYSRMTSAQRIRLEDRYDYLRGLSPQAFVQGAGKFSRYFGAMFATNLVVLENIDYGNAIYVMFDDWAKWSQFSRSELLTSGQIGAAFVRIPHVSGWKAGVAALIETKRLGR